MKLLKIAVAAALGLVSLRAQNFDTSGNGMLKGAFRFRHVSVMNIDSNYDPFEIAAAFGVITFDGSGHYTITGTYVDNQSRGNSLSGFGTSGVQQPLNVSGVYAISANGYGYVANPFFPSDLTEADWGAVAQGVFIGSDTESATNANAQQNFGLQNDLFIAIPVGTPPVNSGLNAPYWVGLLDFPAGVSTAEKNAMFQLMPNGQGGLGSLKINGFARNQGGTNLSQTVTGATYNFAQDGNASLSIPLPSGTTTANALFTGSKSMFVSADGNFVLGWTPSGYDVFFGVRSLSPPPDSSFAGNYFVSGLDDNTATGDGTGSYYGSLVANGLGSITMDQRFEFAPLYAEDFVCSATVQFNLDGTGDVLVPPCSPTQYMFSDSGKAFVGIGFTGDYSLVVGLAASPKACSGLCINTTAVYNAASYAPVTSPLAPGELLTMYVSGLPAVEKQCIGGQACPTSLGGIQVLMNNAPVPVFSVSGSAGTVSAIVPYEISPSTQTFLQIQINSGGTLSNIFTQFTGFVLPGIFTYSQNGLGPAIAEHANGTFVTSQNPALPNETIVMVLTGAGTVTPTISDGAVPSTTTLSYADYSDASVSCSDLGNGRITWGYLICALFHDYTNNVHTVVTPAFIGLAPGFAAEYQMNVTVPATAVPGTLYLELYTPLAIYNSIFGFEVNQVQIPVGGSGSGSARPEARQPAGPIQVHRRPTGVSGGRIAPRGASAPIRSVTQ